MKLRTRALNLAAVVIVALNVHAHPGHAPFSEGAKHFVTSPSHIGPVLIFAAILIVAAQFLKRRGERNLVRAVAAAITLLAVLSQ